MRPGWIKKWRKTLDSAIWGLPPVQYKVSDGLLMLANHESKKMLFDGNEIEIKPGQILSSQKKLCEDLRVTRQNLRSALVALTKLDFLTIKSTNTSTLISITKWHTYQDSQPTGNQEGNQRVTNDQPTEPERVTTTKEYNIIKNVIMEEGKKISASRNQPNPDIKLFIDWYFQEYRKAMGDAYLVSGADAKAVQRALGTFDLARLKELAGEFLCDPLSWMDKPEHTIAMFVSKINRYGKATPMYDAKTIAAATGTLQWMQKRIEEDKNGQE